MKVKSERGPGIALQAMQEKKALSSRGRGRLRGCLELRRPWGFSPEAGALCWGRIGRGMSGRVWGFSRSGNWKKSSGEAGFEVPAHHGHGGKGQVLFLLPGL